MFRNSGLIFTPSYRCNLFSTALELSAAGLGIACMSARAAEPMISSGQLVAIPIDNPVAHETQCHLLRNSDRRFTPAAHHLWQLLRNYFSEMSDRTKKPQVADGCAAAMCCFFAPSVRHGVSILCSDDRRFNISPVGTGISAVNLPAHPRYHSSGDPRQTQKGGHCCCRQDNHN